MSCFNQETPMKDFKPTLILSSLLLASGALAGVHQDNLQTLRSIPLVNGLEQRSAKNEAYITSELKNIFRDIQQKAAKPDSTLDRATHNKGTCFDADFTMLSRLELKENYKYSDKLINELKQGIFSAEKNYPAQIRFANAKGDRNPDTTGDVRGIGLSLDLKGDSKDYSGESRQDYSFNSTPMFAVNNIKEFHELMKTAALASGNFGYIPNPFYLKSTLKASKLLKQYERADTKSFAQYEYWGNIPNTHGKNIAKMKLAPCDGKGSRFESSVGKAANFLQQDIVKKAAAGEVCFLYQVQLFDHKKLIAHNHANWAPVDWIENGGELWPEEVLPFHTIAKIEIKKNSPKVSCDGWYVNPRLHANPQNMPIGSISRVRAEVEEASRARRQGDL